jgi:hypothetical protein
MFLDPFAFSMVEIPVIHLITFQKLFWKGTQIIHWKCMKNDPSSRLLCCWVLGMVDASNRCSGDCHFFTNSKIPLAISYCPNLSCNKGQSSVIINASKMIHLSDIFVVGKSQYSTIYVSGSFFSANGKMSTKLL